MTQPHWYYSETIDTINAASKPTVTLYAAIRERAQRLHDARIVSCDGIDADIASVSHSQRSFDIKEVHPSRATPCALPAVTGRVFRTKF